MIQQGKFQAAIRVIEKIEQAGFEAYIVGGAVRDYLLNKEVNDIDITTSAFPEEVKSIFSSTIDVGIEHGTVIVLDEKEPFEVTTYRTDGTYEDHRRPEQVFFVRNLEEDLMRRDFTINAMAMTKNGEIVDLFGGKEDLQNKIIKAVGNPTKRFQEDALRMLRAVRFSARLGFFIEEETLKAIQKDHELIKFIAKERIQMELSKLWTSPFVYNGIVNLVESGLAKHLKGDFQRHLEDWKHFSCKQPEVGWAYLSLLNNFKSEEIVEYYKLSNKDKSFMNNVKLAYQSLLKGWRPFDYFNYPLDILEASFDFAVWQRKSLTIKKEDIKETKAYLPIQSKEELAINGHILKTLCDKKPGPWIKKAIDEAIEKVLTKEIENNEEQLKEWFLNEFKYEG